MALRKNLRLSKWCRKRKRGKNVVFKVASREEKRRKSVVSKMDNIGNMKSKIRNKMQIISKFILIIRATNNHNFLTFYSKENSGRGRGVVKVSDRGWPCHEFQPSTTLKIRRVREQCTLNLSRAQTSSRWCGVVVKRGRCQLGCRPRHFTMVQNNVVSRKKPSCS
ncbi:uncharacterized protein TNCV_1683561 [Trichonephila clavipes]|nr:uncharacterized protein TNCV_1683561 [Trichonephila clavipes]